MADKKNAFLEMLESQRSGALLYDLEDEMKIISKKVEETGGSGEITLVIKLSSAGENIIKVFDQIKSKQPKRKTPGSVFFTNTDGSLSRKNERQPELPFAKAEAASSVTPIKSA